MTHMTHLSWFVKATKAAPPSVPFGSRPQSRCRDVDVDFPIGETRWSLWMSRGYPAEAASNGGAKAVFTVCGFLLSWFLVFKVFEVLNGN